jgi:hypothetical protein
MTQRGEVALAALTLLLGIGAPPGCASEKTTTTTTTTHLREPGVTAAPDAASDRLTEQQTVTTTTEEDDSCSGMLSCTADFVGDVIAFPFRLIGGVVKALF